MGKTATKENVKRVPFNWTRLKKMWDEAKSYLEMAKALDAHYRPDGDDPTKSIRAKCSVAMNKGIKLNGKLVRFKRRSKPNEKSGLNPKATATKQAKKTTPKAKEKKPTAKKSAKVTVITSDAAKPVQPTEA